MNVFTQKRKSFVLLSILSIFTLMLSPFGGLLSAVNAAPVVVYIDLAASAGPVAPATVTTAPEVATSTADEFYLSYTASATEFGIGDTVTVIVPAGFGAVAACGTPTDDADLDTTTDVGAAVVTGNIAIGWQVEWTFTAATTDAVTDGVEFCVAATTPATAGNYSWAVSDTNDSDTGPALVYVGDDNDVLVTATVPATLSLRIKEAASTLDTNVCELGVLNPASVNSCAYRIAAGTNNAGGLEVYVIADNQLNNVGDTADIDDTTANTDVVAGTEAHGVRVTLGTGYTVGGSFSVTNDNPVPLAETLVLDAAAAVDDSDTATWSTITHYASVDTSTSADSYDQIVTYRAWIQT